MVLVNRDEHEVNLARLTVANNNARIDDNKAVRAIIYGMALDGELSRSNIENRVLDPEDLLSPGEYRRYVRAYNSASERESMLDNASLVSLGVGRVNMFVPYPFSLIVDITNQRFAEGLYFAQKDAASSRVRLEKSYREGLVRAAYMHGVRDGSDFRESEIGKLLTSESISAFTGLNLSPKSSDVTDSMPESIRGELGAIINDYEDSSHVSKTQERIELLVEKTREDLKKNSELLIELQKEVLRTNDYLQRQELLKAEQQQEFYRNEMRSAIKIGTILLSVTGNSKEAKILSTLGNAAIDAHMLMTSAAAMGPWATAAGYLGIAVTVASLFSGQSEDPVMKGINAIREDIEHLRKEMMYGFASLQRSNVVLLEQINTVIAENIKTRQILVQEIYRLHRKEQFEWRFEDRKDLDEAVVDLDLATKDGESALLEDVDKFVMHQAWNRLINQSFSTFHSTWCGPGHDLVDEQLIDVIQSRRRLSHLTGLLLPLARNMVKDRPVQDAMGPVPSPLAWQKAVSRALDLFECYPQENVAEAKQMLDQARGAQSTIEFFCSESVEDALKADIRKIGGEIASFISSLVSDKPIVPAVAVKSHHEGVNGFAALAGETNRSVNGQLTTYLRKSGSDHIYLVVVTEPPLFTDLKDQQGKVVVQFRHLNARKEGGYKKNQRHEDVAIKINLEPYETDEIILPVTKTTNMFQGNWQYQWQVARVHYSGTTRYVPVGVTIETKRGEKKDINGFEDLINLIAGWIGDTNKVDWNNPDHVKNERERLNKQVADGIEKNNGKMERMHSALKTAVLKHELVRVLAQWNSGRTYSDMVVANIESDIIFKNFWEPAIMAVKGDESPVDQLKGHIEASIEDYLKTTVWPASDGSRGVLDPTLAVLEAFIQRYAKYL